MKGSSSFLSRSYGLLSLALIAFVFLFLHNSRGGSDEISVNAGGSELQMRGKQFRNEVERTFLEMSKANARRSYDLIEVCRTYFPAGTSFADIRVIMAAARGKQEEPLWAAHNPNFSAENLDINDIGSGFAIEKSLISNSVFGVVFRPDTLGDTKKIAKVVSCGVLTTNL